MGRARHLVVVADDFGIGPESDRAILELAADGLVTSAVLLVNSPYAPAAVAAWDRAGRPVELGWHPALTIDRPVLPAERVPSLVDAEGRFWPLGRFLRRSVLGQLCPTEVAGELAAQYHRFWELVGAPPRLVNSHQHVSLFRPVTAALHELL
ncbi:MAG TPA: ChbG/HpnK family deacetylase, partial [Gemmataceae bacterium]|nr:ChbG/HpnK family deacetylase [Gemmataceae bacterium]